MSRLLLIFVVQLLMICLCTLFFSLALPADPALHLEEKSNELSSNFLVVCLRELNWFDTLLLLIFCFVVGNKVLMVAPYWQISIWFIYVLMLRGIQSRIYTCEFSNFFLQIFTVAC